METAGHRRVTGKSLIGARPLTGEGKVAVSAGIILTVAFVFVVQVFGGALKPLSYFPLLAVLLIVAGNYLLALAAVVVCLYVDVHIAYYSSAVALSFFLVLSFIVTHRDIAWKGFASPLTAPILVYGLCIVPSFLNASKPDMSIVGLGNVAAFLVVLYTAGAGLKTHREIRQMAGLYLAVTFLNGLIVIALSAAGERRPFGVSGIMYVDYAALGVCMSVAMSAVSRGSTRVLLAFLACVITLALILTQTRNTWISAGITLTVLIMYLIMHPEIAGLSRKKLFAVAVAAIVGIAVLGAVVVSLNPNVARRATELTGGGMNPADQQGSQINSLVSRYLIWDTALHAFIAHPVVGIGAYAFPYSSRHYSTLPAEWYELYVEGNSPHETYIAVLAETGVVGMLGFLVFVVAALRCAYRSIALVPHAQGKRYGFVAAIGVTYCFVSMGFTDAWMWGQGIVLLGIVLAAMVANRRIGLAGAQPAPPGGIP
jgi:O-antigen ligase